MKTVIILNCLSKANKTLAIGLLILFSIHGFANGKDLPNPEFSARISVKNVSACGNGLDGEILAIPNGGVAPFSFQWTGPNGFTSNLDALYHIPYGFYNLTLSDAVGHTYSVNNIHVAKAYNPVITHNGAQSGACNNSGTLILYASAGVGPYSYSLDGINYQESNLFVGLGAGNYTLFARDAGGCVGTSTAIVVAANPLTISPYVRNSTACADDGQIQVFISGGTPPYLYSLDGVNYQVSNTFSNLPPAGGYNAYVKDGKGCVKKSINLTIARNAPLTVSASRTNSSSCVNTGAISIMATGGYQPFNYSIDGIHFYPTPLFTSLAAGTYTCYVKDAKNCSGTTTVIIGTTPINAYASVLPNNPCNNQGTFMLFPLSGNGPFFYSNDHVNFRASNVFTGLQGGTYTGWVKDSRGCVVQVNNIVVPVGQSLTVSATKINTSPCVNDGSITVSASGGAQPYTYRLNNGSYGANPVFSQLGSGSYLLYAKDATGCGGTINAAINVVPIVVSASSTPVTDCIVNDGSIAINHTGGKGNMLYSLDGNIYQQSNVFTGLEEGFYDAYVKDQNVCIGVQANVQVFSDCSSFSKTRKANDNAVIQKIQIGPNPSATSFNLALPNNIFGPSSIMVYDGYGRMVWQKSGVVSGNCSFGSDFIPGIYRVVVVSGNQRTTLAVIKQ